MKKWALFFWLLTSISSEKSTFTRDPASEQLVNYKRTHADKHYEIHGDSGAPLEDITASLTVGPLGPILLQDVATVEAGARFVREPIIDRGETAKGAGAFGYFEVTNDITKYCKAALFSSVGKRTKLVVRFTPIGADRGSPDTKRNRRGFSIKFYTEEGNWDLLGLTTTTLFVRDGMQFFNFVESLGRNPVTNIRDVDMQWDFITLNPESTFDIMFVFSDKGIPDGFRHMDAHGVNIFKMVNQHGEITYVRFHYLTNQGVRNLSPERALNLSATSPDYAVRDLYNAIALGNFPSWTLYIQVMTPEEAERQPHYPFDAAREWSLEEFPLVEIGRIFLTENPSNFFQDVEQSAFCPGNLVPGIETSPDRMLQARTIVYTDSQRHRLGVNFMQLPVNRPLKMAMNYHINGQGNIDHHDGRPVYFPNSFSGPKNVPSAAISTFHVSGNVGRYNNSFPGTLDQSTALWKSLSEDEKQKMVSNMAESLGLAASFLQKRAIELFLQVDFDFARRLKERLKNVR